MHYTRLRTKSNRTTAGILCAACVVEHALLLLWLLCRDVHGWTHARRAT